MKLLWQIMAGILGIFLADTFVYRVNLAVIPDRLGLFGITLTAYWQILILIGTILGLINFFLKPVLNLITLPLRVLTLGLFGLILNMAIIWILDVLFLELDIIGLGPLFWTTVIVWGINFLLKLYQSRMRLYQSRRMANETSNRAREAGF